MQYQADFDSQQHPSQLSADQLKYVEGDVQLFFGDVSQGSGTLYLTTTSATWIGDASPNTGYVFPWRDIVMHAISRDTSNFPLPCIYAHLDTGDDAEMMAMQHEEEEEEEEEGEGDNDEAVQGSSGASEVRFAPGASESLGVLFGVFCECQALHPEEEEEGEGDFYFDEEEVQRGQARVTQHIESLLSMPRREDVDGLLDNNGDDPYADVDDDEEEEEYQEGN